MSIVERLRAEKSFRLSENGPRHRTLINPDGPEAADLIEQLRSALEELQAAEARYRYAHDILGAGDSKTGRAWDLMKRAGDKARELLDSLKGSR